MQADTGYLYNLLVAYGWAGSDADEGRAARTDALVEAGLLEEKDLDKTPTFCVGDLNAKATSLPTLVAALAAGDWVDVGSLRHLHVPWSQSTADAGLVPQGWPTPNCWAHGAKAPTRRTFVLANRRALTMLDCVTVGPWTQVDVHAQVYMGVKPVAPVTIKRQRNLATLHPPAKPTPSDPQATERDKVAAANAHREQWKTKLQAAMTATFRATAARFDGLLAQGDTTKYFVPVVRLR